MNPNEVTIKRLNHILQKEESINLLFEKRLQGGLSVFKTIVDENNLEESWDNLFYYVCSKDSIVHVEEFPCSYSDKIDYGELSNKDKILEKSDNFFTSPVVNIESLSRDSLLKIGDSVIFNDYAKATDHIYSACLALDIDMNDEFTICDTIIKYKEHDMTKEHPYLGYILMDSDDNYFEEDITANDIISTFGISLRESETSTNNIEQILAEQEAEKDASKSAGLKL